MAMVNLEIIEIIHEVYEDLLHKVILKNIPKDCPDIREIRINYLIYLVEMYKSHKPIGEDKKGVKEYIISQQNELWADEVPYNIYRNFVHDKMFDSLVELSTLSFRLAHISHKCDITMSKEKRDKAVKGFAECVKNVKPCFREYANDFATEGYKDIMYASGDRKEMSDRLKETIEMEKGY